MTAPVNGPGSGGRWVGGYELTRRLGSGGMGEVYLGRDREGRQAAVKLVHAELADDPEFRARFRNEVAAAERVLSYFTVPVVGADPEGDPPWLATSYVDGPSLGEALAQGGPLPHDRLCSLAAALGEALVVIHGAGIVHRDLKPSNVLLTGDGPRVIDFGIARAADATALTGTGMMIGTFGYASPEQLTGSAPVEAASDVFSLGAVLLFAATGRHPFGEGPGATIAYRTVHEDADTAGVTGPLLPLVRACLAKEPGRRPTPREVIAAARAAQSALAPWDGSPEPTSYRLAPPPPRPAPPPPVTPPRRRRPWWPLVAAAAVLAVLAAVFVPRLLDDDAGGTPQGKEPGGGASSSSPPASSATPPNESARTAPAGPGSDVLPAAQAEGVREKKWTADVSGSDDERYLLGGWLHKGTATRVDWLGARGYDAANGDELWTVKPPNNLRTCSASAGPSATSGGIGALSFGKDPNRQDKCTRVGAVDTGSGKLLWHKDIGASHGAGITLGMTGRTLVASGERGVVGLDRRTGKELWHYTEGVDNCSLFIATVGRRTVVLLQTCSGGDGVATSANTVRELDAATGEVRWTHRLPVNVTEPRVLTTEPVAVSLGRGGDSSKNSLLVLDLKGRAHHEVALNGPYGELDLVRGEVDGRMLSEGDVVAAQTRGLSGRQAELVVIDTESGKVRLHEPLPFGGMNLLSLGDGKVTGMVEYSSPDEPTHIVRFDLDDGSTDGDGTLPYVAAMDGIGNVVAASGRQVVVFASSSKSRIGAVGFG